VFLRRSPSDPTHSAWVVVGLGVAMAVVGAFVLLLVSDGSGGLVVKSVILTAGGVAVAIGGLVMVARGERIRR